MAAQKKLTIPLDHNTTAELSTPFPLTAEQWGSLAATVLRMRPEGVQDSWFDGQQRDAAPPPWTGQHAASPAS